MAELLDGTPGKIRAYDTSMKREITPADGAARLKHLRDTFGFDAFKVRAGTEVARAVSRHAPNGTPFLLTAPASAARA